MRQLFSALVICLAALSAQGHEPIQSAGAAQAFGWDFDAIDVRTETVAPDLHVLFGAGGNVAVSIGESGVLMVDDQFPEMVPKLKTAIADLGGDGVDFVINTHWHFDHADGNSALAGDGAWIVAQANTRRMMSGTHDIDLVGSVVRQAPYPDEALPVISFTDDVHFHFNGQRIDVLHYGPAHTTGDAVVIFRGANAIHTGDVFVTTGYPFIDAGSGGTLDGFISFIRAILTQIDEDTVVIPGHGSIAGHSDVVAFLAMLETVRASIAELLDQGMSLEEVTAAAPTAAFDEKYGDPTRFINRAYHSLAR